MTPSVFLCEPSGLTHAQRLVSDQWHERLFGFGFTLINCEVTATRPTRGPV